MQDVWIWPLESGINDLESEEGLASMRELERDWAREKAQLADQGGLEAFEKRLNREWAIETGQIENLYRIERGVTLTLIEQGFQAALIPRGSVNRDEAYVLNLLRDQENALEGLFDFVKRGRDLSTSYIKELHAAMTRSQTTVEAFDPSGNRVEVPMIHGDWKSQENFPERDEKRFRYCPPEQTASEMERLVAMHLQHLDKSVAPEVEAAWIHHRFTQIHPFQDGNGRVARALATLVLLRAGLFPLVVPLEEKDAYLDHLERADAGDLLPLVYDVALRQQEAHRLARKAMQTGKDPDPS